MKNYVEMKGAGVTSLRVEIQDPVETVPEVKDPETGELLQEKDTVQPPNKFFISVKSADHLLRETVDEQPISREALTSQKSGLVNQIQNHHAAITDIKSHIKDIEELLSDMDIAENTSQQ